MSDCMTFPDTVEEFMEQYKIVDTEQVYTNGTELVPIFRMKQWFEHSPSVQPEITNEEIRFALKQLRVYFLIKIRDKKEGDVPVELLQCIEEIQEYIGNLPSAQPEQCDFEKQLHDMFDHIWYCEINHPVFKDTVGDLMRAVIEAHYRTSQPEIIRCRDCKWSDISAMGHLAVCNHARGLINASPNSYCNFAERRTDEPDKQAD